MEMKFCYACGMPLDGKTAGQKENYCSYCLTADGELKSREEVRQGIAQWMKMWQPDVDDEKASIRADAYMNGMPEWAKK